MTQANAEIRRAATIEAGYELADGARIPKIGFGTYDLAKGDETKCAVEAAIEAGYRLIDCARFYGNEASVGAAIAQSGVARGDLFITSKVWNDRQLLGPDEVRRSVEETLAALGIDQLDLLLVHWPVRDCYRKTWEVFQQLKQEGLTRSIGVSNFTREHLAPIAAAGEELPVLDQMEQHPYMQDADTRACLAELGILMEAWSPLGRGACTADDAVQRIAAAHGVDAGQAILAWHIAKGVLPLPRSSKPARVASNLLALDVELSAEEVAALDALNRNEYVTEMACPAKFNEYLNAIPSPRD